MTIGQTPFPNYGIAISISDLIISLVVALAISVMTALVYRFTHRGLNYERSFLITLVLVAPIVSLVMMLIGSNLALSLGMVGALSIIRFRTVIKDSRDMVFLFWAIAIGLGCGTYNWLPIFVASLVIAGMMLLLHFVQYGKAVHSDYVLVVAGQKETEQQEILKCITSYSDATMLRSYDDSDEGWELVYEVRLQTGDSFFEDEITKKLRSIVGVKKVSLLAPRLALPV